MKRNCTTIILKDLYLVILRYATLKKRYFILFIYFYFFYWLLKLSTTARVLWLAKAYLRKAPTP